ncbi:MAG: CoA pyrophosphatase [Odoribacter sp.]|nr:CoA pyrophosphatase [Odoribacter sp.]
MKRIKTPLYSVLPGKEAQDKMAPVSKYIEGGENVYNCPPVESAVMILAIPSEDKLVIPFIKRTQKGRHHAGQIALPGGKKEESDNSFIETALREYKEEIGVKSEDIVILGTLSPIYIPVSNFTIHPVVGTTIKKPTFKKCEDEVEEIILVPISELFNPENKRTQNFSQDRREVTAPGYHIGGYFIWGATAMIIAEMEQIMKNYTLSIKLPT